MPRGRPRKPLGWHLLTNKYRPSRHGALPGMSPAPEPKIDPAVSRASNPAIEFLALPETVRQWEGLLCSGKDYFHMLPDGITEAKARKMARAKWGEFGRELVAYWRTTGARHTRGRVGPGSAGARPSRDNATQPRSSLQWRWRAVTQGGCAAQLDDMLKDRPWRGVAEFAAYVCQTETLHLKPCEEPPSPRRRSRRRSSRSTA
jgi:hypothetical protein